MSVITSLAVRRLAVAIAMQRYGQMPDADDRVADALAALVEAEHGFKSIPGKDTDGYRVRYALGKVAGSIRNRAQAVKENSASEIAATDLGVEQLFYDGKGTLLGEDRLWVVHGKVTPESTLLAASADPEALKLALDNFGLDDFYAAEHDEEVEALFTYFVPEQEPLFLSDIPDAEAVLAATRGNAQWDAEELWNDHEDVRLDEQSKIRPCNALARDRYSWSTDTLQAWQDARREWGWITNPEPILAYLAGETDLPDERAAHDVIRAMESLSDIIVEDTDDDNFDAVGHSVARSLAERIVRDGLTYKPSDGSMVETLRCAFIDYFGAEPDGWDPPDLPSAEILREQTAEWLKGLKCWPSQRIGINALVMGASPYEARQAEQAWFNNR